MTETSNNHEASRKCYQIHNATNSLRVVDVEHCLMGTRFLLYKDKMLRPSQKWTDGKKTKVSDIQVNQDQQEEPIDNIANTRMTMLSPGTYGHQQFPAIVQHQMAYFKNQNRSQIFTHPQMHFFYNPVTR